MYFDSNVNEQVHSQCSEVMAAEELEVDPWGAENSKNVCKKLASKIKTSLLVHHCCGHKSNLIAGNSWKTIPYLREIEKRIKSLHKQLSRSGKAQNQLMFWSAVCNDAVLTELRFCRTRWLSQLGPMKMIHKNYTSFLSYTLGQ